LRSRVEQGAELSRLWIERGEIASLVSVSTPAGERQIFNLGRAAVLLRYDMIYLVWEERNLDREQAVLAMVPCPLDHLSAQRRGDVG